MPLEGLYGCELNEVSGDQHSLEIRDLELRYAAQRIKPTFRRKVLTGWSEYSLLYSRAVKIVL